MFNLVMPKFEDESLKGIFDEIALGSEEFDFVMYQEAKKRNPELFEALESPSNCMREYLA